MKDIIFYYKKKNDEVIAHLSERFPHAKFEKCVSNIVELVNKVKATSKTNFFWLIDVDIAGYDTLLTYNIETWDQSVVHVFKSITAEIYLIPKNVDLGTSTTIENKKVISVSNLVFRHYDVFFLSFDESIADKNLQYLKEKRPDTKHIQGVKGIFNAHLAAAKQSSTDFFWVIDADATVLDSFDFNYRVPEWDFDVVHIWKSVNLINMLEYGYGGIKLIPKHLILNADETTAVDITTSIGAKIKIMNEISSNINNFATSPLNAWRSAFRECVKLASGVIDRQIQTETDERLLAWTSRGGNRPLGEYVKGGASAGEWYGKTYKGDKNALAMINDYNWLKEQFEAHIKLFPPEMFLDQEETKSKVNGNTEAITEAQALATS